MGWGVGERVHDGALFLLAWGSVDVLSKELRRVGDCRVCGKCCARLPSPWPIPTAHACARDFLNLCPCLRACRHHPRQQGAGAGGVHPAGQP